MYVRLSAEAGAALRAEAQRTGRSQQDILREAVSTYLGLVPRVPFRDVRPRLHSQPEDSSLDLLDRDDRI
jgi:Ribbon-helix-helix protein, copG family